MRRSSSLVIAVEVTCATLLAFACSSSNEGGGGGGYGTGGSTQQGTGSSTGNGTCGNGTVDTGEECDQANLNGGNCASATANSAPIGVLRCSTDCSYDTSGCTNSSGSTGGSVGAGGSQSAGGATGTGGLVGNGGTASTGGTGSSGGGSGPTPSSLPTATQTCPNIPAGANQTVTFLGAQVNTWAGPAAKTNGPLLLYWHATGTNSGEVVSAFGSAATNDVVANGGVVASFTNTVGTGTNTGNNVWYTDDFKIADEVVACAIKQYQIDTRRIFSAGYSAGGLQTGTASYLRDNYIASVVIYSGGAIVTSPNPNPSNHPAAICAHGAPGTNFSTNDYLILDFGAACTSYLQGLKNAGGFGIDCNDGGNHTAIAQRFAVGPAAWQFLKDHPFGVTPEPYTSLNGFPSYCKIF